MLTNHKFYRTGFGEQTFEIRCDCDSSHELATFLFRDLPGSTSTNKLTSYYLITAGEEPRLTLSCGKHQLYTGDSDYQLAYHLMNEVIFHCINENSQQHALHAGAVFKDDQCILLPGTSGKGKSTLTAWLVGNGYQYLTDELVFLTNEGDIKPFTRPISLKTNVNDTIITELLKGADTKEVTTDKNGSMIPHRLLNPQFFSSEPRVTHILYPEYKEGVDLLLEEITPAKSSLYLIPSHVNARNLSGHGVAEISNIVRKCRSYKLSYGRLDDLEAIFNKTNNLFGQ